MSNKMDVRVTVFCKERYGGDWPPEDAAGFLAWFAEKISRVPPEHVQDVTVSLDSESGYEGESYPKIEIYYWRKETDAEVEKRISEERDQVAAREKKERKIYEQLRAKYEQR